MTKYNTRFAPSPNGYLHLGHAFSAKISEGIARNSSGKFFLRIEDIDTGRCNKEFEKNTIKNNKDPTKALFKLDVVFFWTIYQGVFGYYFLASFLPLRSSKFPRCFSRRERNFSAFSLSSSFISFNIVLIFSCVTT